MYEEIWNQDPYRIGRAGTTNSWKIWINHWEKMDKCGIWTEDCQEAIQLGTRFLEELKYLLGPKSDCVMTWNTSLLTQVAACP
jgi:hypothetical protein